MINVRKAKISEIEVLTDIASNSESYWGYDFEYMKKFKELYKVTEEIIENNLTFVIEKNKNIIGFYSILVEKNKVSLEYFFIQPKYICNGYGRLLWNHMKEQCKNLQIKNILIVTSPEAKEFYLKMGAVQIGEIESLVKKNRKIPQLMYKF